jgi:hypothetical protein
MAWLKGVRTDGFIKIDENVNFRGTVVGASDGIMRPYGALDYYVDGTDGKDSYSGKSWEGAFKTIQKAITTQIADTNAKGDRIWIAPGTYSEAIVAPTLTKVELIGATCGGEAKAVIINNTAGHALCVGEDDTWTSTMVNSAIRNITFYTPSASSQELAAVRIDTMVSSVIDNCKFLGNYNASGVMTTIGLQLGCLSDANNSFHEFGTISNCEFGSSGSGNKEVDTAIRVGSFSVTTLVNTGFKHMKIVNNLIRAEDMGIQLGCGAGSCGGSEIRGNSIHSHQGGGGVNVAVQSMAEDGTDMLMMIIGNNVNYKSHGFHNFETRNLHRNTVSIDNVDPIGLYPG